MLHSDEIILRKIIKEVDFSVERLKGESFEDFEKDIDAQHAVGMAAINVGELIKHISDGLRKEYRDIPWKEAAGLRDVVAHAYDTIKLEDLFATVKEDFPSLKDKLTSLLVQKK